MYRNRSNIGRNICITGLICCMVLIVIAICVAHGGWGHNQPLLDRLSPDDQEKLRPLLLSREQFSIQKELGRGAFGEVFKGHMQQAKGDIAIKITTDNREGSDIAFVKEALVMAGLQHENILSIIGVCIDSKRPMIILPYMDNGDLKTYLQRFKPSNVRMLLLFCLHISRGMDYLAKRGIVHRDLAARNCLVGTDLMVKISDFGLARDVYPNSYYRQYKQHALPFKWMALECLGESRVFTTETDIWSFGVTVWEVFTGGRDPYDGLGNGEIYDYLQKGHRLVRPQLCPDIMYELMSRCFVPQPAMRPGFADISEKISNYIKKLSF